MKPNVGEIDREIRLILGVMLGLAAFSLPGTWAWIAGVLAVVGIVTGLTTFCALYAALGIHTNHRELARLAR
jgi:amino acid transporter